MKKISAIAAAQFVALLGSQLTSLGLAFWLYEQTGSVTVYGLSTFATLGPLFLLAPLGGALVDRWSARTAMMVGHAVSWGFTSIAIGLWALDLLAAPVAIGLLCLASAANAVQAPGLSVAITWLARPSELVRANGIAQLHLALATVIAPALAAMLVTSVGLGAILALDAASGLVALAVLALVRLPRLARGASPRSVLAGWVEGVRFVKGHPGLLLALVVVSALNFNMGMAQVLIVPIVTAVSSLETLGLIQSLASLGFVLGAVVLALWGGPQRLAASFVGCLLGQGILLVVCAARPSAALVGATAFAFLFTAPFGGSASQALWQRKVPPRIQGSVFALRTAVGYAALPLALLAAGPLADRVFEPLMRAEGALATSVGLVLGVGPGRGAALLLAIVGLGAIVTAFSLFCSPRLRRVEHEVPDHWRSSSCLGPLRADLLLSVALGGSLFGAGCGSELTVPADGSAPPPDARMATIDAGNPLEGRSYDLHEAPGYDGDEPVPLVVMIHPMLASDEGAEVMDEYLGLTAEADERGVLVAIPHGTYDPVLGAYMWNATDSCCAFFTHRPDDAGFIMAMVEEIRAEHSVDPNRIYIVGQSNGGFMAHRLACENAGVFAAFVSISGAMLSNPAECEPSSPVAAMHVHGTADGLVPFEGGAPFDVLSIPHAPSAHETIATWADRDGCDPTPSDAVSLDLVPAIEGAETERVVYSGCEAHGAAELWIVRESAHLPEFTREFIDRAFDFLFAHPKGDGSSAE